MAERDLERVHRGGCARPGQPARVPGGGRARRRARPSSPRAAGRHARPRRRRRHRPRPSAAPSAAAARQRRAAAEPSYAIEGELFMYNWADYIDPEQHRGVQGRVRHHELRRTTRTPPTRSCWPSSRAARPACTTSCAPTAEFVPAMVDQGFIQKLDFSRIPNAAVHQPAVQGLLRPGRSAGQVQRVPHAQGLGHDRHRAAPQDRQRRRSTSWKEFFEVAPEVLGQDRRRRLRRRRHAAPLKALGYSLNSTDPTELEEARELLHGPRAARPRPRLRHVRGQAADRARPSSA